jgi:hypothetical protein
MLRAALALAMGLAVLGGAAVSADWVMNSVLQGDLGRLDLHAVVTYEWETATYAYLYELTATDTVSPVHYLDLGNPYALYFWGAFNDGGFADPTYQPYLTSMIWGEGDMQTGEVLLFGFASMFPPTEVSISALDRGQRSIGSTLGMVPEPALGFVSAAVVGALSLWRRRR